jgi:plant G-box-binding factor
MPVILPISASGTPGGFAGPATNLNIGMDYWGTPTSSNIPTIRGKVPYTTVAGGVVTSGSRDSVQSQLWLQLNNLENRTMKFILFP